MPFLDSEAQFPYGGVRRTGMAEHFEQYSIALDLLPDSLGRWRCPRAMRAIQDESAAEDEEKHGAAVSS